MTSYDNFELYARVERIPGIVMSGCVKSYVYGDCSLMQSNGKQYIEKRNVKQLAVQ